MVRVLRYGIGGTGLLTVCGVVLLAASGCSGWRGGSAENPVRPLTVHVSEAGQYGPSRTPLRMVVHDAGTLARVRMGHLEVDFSRQMVLLACMGRVAERGRQIRIEAVWEEGRRVYARVKAYPPAGEKAGRGPAQPYHVIVVDRSDYNVEGFSAAPPRRRLGRRR